MTDAASKVLIVDGNEQIALLSSFLKQEVITPVVAHTGEAALEKIRSEHFDALVVDMKLPDMDGMQIMKGAKALDEDLPVILITGYPEIRDAVAAMRAGAHDYLAKPLKHHEVLRVVFRALNERALKRKLRRLSCQIEDEQSPSPSETEHETSPGPLPAELKAARVPITPHEAITHASIATGAALLALLCATFDPITRPHIFTAEEALKQTLSELRVARLNEEYSALMRRLAGNTRPDRR